MRPVEQGDLGLLQHPASQELLKSKIPARLAYVWSDGTPALYQSGSTGTDAKSSWRLRPRRRS